MSEHLSALPRSTYIEDRSLFIPERLAKMIDLGQTIRNVVLGQLSGSSYDYVTSIGPLLLLTTAYLALAPKFNGLKKKSYILSAISSFVMSLGGLYFGSLWWRSRLSAVIWSSHAAVTPGSIDKIFDLHIESLSRLGTRFFRCFLFADLFIGYLFYPSEIGALTGWVHHICYFGIMTFMEYNNYGGIFMLAANLEIPTFHLAIGTLFPQCRNDAVFLTIFFLIRILFHGHLISMAALPASRELVNGSWVPFILLTLAMPLHILWFWGGVKGYIKRRKTRRAVKTANKAASVEVEQMRERLMQKSPRIHSSETPAIPTALSFALPEQPTPKSVAGPGLNEISPEMDTPLLVPSDASSETLQMTRILRRNSEDEDGTSSIDSSALSTPPLSARTLMDGPAGILTNVRDNLGLDERFDELQAWRDESMRATKQWIKGRTQNIPLLSLPARAIRRRRPNTTQSEAEGFDTL